MDRARFCRCDECGAMGLWNGIYMMDLDEFAYFCPDCWHHFRDHLELSSFLMHKNKLARENLHELAEVE